MPKSANPLQIFTKSANPSGNLAECAKLCQNSEPFHWNLHQKCSPTRSAKKIHFYDKIVKAECDKNGRPSFVFFSWCRLCSKTTNPSRPSWEIPKSANPLKQIPRSANPFQYVPRPCRKVRPLCEPSPEVRTLCESAPKVRTLSRFRRARAQKREPFAGLRQKREPFQGFGEHVPESANPRRILPASANPFEP